MEQPKWLDKKEYPFTSRFIETPSGKIHYIDEGEGPVLFFYHGTPEWSFSYRELIKKLKGNYRCIAPDMLGFGLSPKPADGNYSVKAHAERAGWMIEKLQLKKVILIAGDFGGSMAIHYGVNHPENVKGLILWNTWCRRLNEDKHFRMPGKLVQTWFGKFLYRRMNFPVKFVMPRAYGDRKKLTKEIHRHYLEPLNSFDNRIGTHEIARELLNAGPFWENLWNRLDELKGIPRMFLWGMKDKFIPNTELEIWKQKWPEAKFVELKEAGHWPHEEQCETMVNEILNFVKGPQE